MHGLYERPEGLYVCRLYPFKCKACTHSNAVVARISDNIEFLNYLSLEFGGEWLLHSSIHQLSKLSTRFPSIFGKQCWEYGRQVIAC